MAAIIAMPTTTATIVGDDVGDVGVVGEVNVPVFRFKIDPVVVQAITGFAKIHQFDDRHDYKQAWKEWCDEHREMLDVEAKRLETSGYTGDVYDKFFKSGRYYFRNKKNVKTEPVERKKYVGLSRNILREMDNYIDNNVVKHTDKETTTSPAAAFDIFCQENNECLLNEITILLNEYNLNNTEITAKLKKTFKNRYFQKVRKN